MSAPDWPARLPADAPLPSPAYRELCEAFVAGVRRVLGDDLHSFYLYGAVAFPRPERWQLDVDYHALVAAPPSAGQRAAIRELHAALAERSPLGRDLDGYYVLLDDARRETPPASLAGAFPSTAGSVVEGPVDDAWALHRAHVHAGRSVLLAGADPRGVLVPPSWPELADGLRSELAYVEGHPEHAAFGVLNACRIAWSVAHRDVVVSKPAAAAWGASSSPAWRPALDAAVRAYTGTPRAGDEVALAEGRGPVLAAARRSLDTAA